MKILLTSIVDPRKALHNRPHQIIKHLSRNHEVTVICINDFWRTRQFDTQSYAQAFEGMMGQISLNYLTERRINPIWQEILSTITVGRLLEKVGYRRFDVHLNYNTLISGCFVAGKLRQQGIGTVYDLADDLPGMIGMSPRIPVALRPFAGFVGRRMVARNIRSSYKTTVTAASLQNTFVIPGNKTEIIPNGVDPELFQCRPAGPLRQRLGLNNSFVIGYVGALREWVDLEPVLVSLKHLLNQYPDIRMLIVGQEGAWRANLRLAEKLGLSDKTVFAGTVPYSEVPAYISCTDVCLIPFKTAPFTANALPLKLFEYMACGKPVISTNLAAIKDAVADKVLYASSMEEWQDRIGRLYHDEALRATMGIEGREFAARNYGWESIMNRMEQVLLEAASSRLP